MDEAHRTLVDAVGNLASSDDWVAVLDISRRLPSHSPLNCLLLASQGATGLVMGYRAWQAIPGQDGRPCQVRRGAKSLKIFAPITKTIHEPDDNGEQQQHRRLVGFRLVSVFDESALVAPPMLPDDAALVPTLLDGDAPAQVWDTLARQVTAAGYRLIDDRTIAPSNGLTDLLARTVAIRPDLPAAQRAKTLAHELAHVLLHDPDRRPPGLTENLAEVEAESVAYLVMGELGVDATAYTIPYVTGWSNGDPDLVVATARRAIGTARDILDGVSRDLSLDTPRENRQSLVHSYDRPAAALDFPAALTSSDPPAVLMEHEPLRVWQDGAFRLEILGSSKRDGPSTGDQPPTQAITYRFWHHDRVVFAGDDIDAPADADPSSDSAVYQVIRLLCDTADNDPARSAAQSVFIAEHGSELLDLVTLPSPPFPPGTRITVSSTRPDGGRTGVVVEPIGEDGHPPTSYAWRPDDANLVGHPWRDNARHVLVTPADELTPTLAAPATGLAGRATHLPLAYGATIEFAADEGETIAATVLRAVRTPDGVAYDVLPEASGADLVRIPAGEAQPRTGTAWPDIDHLFAARQASSIPLEQGELLAAGDTVHTLVETADGLVPAPLTSTELPSTPAADATATGFTTTPEVPAPATVTLRSSGDMAQIGDPRHGWLNVPTNLLASALTMPAGDLADALEGTGRSLAGDEAPLTLAALVARDRPDLLARVDPAMLAAALPPPAVSL